MPDAHLSSLRFDSLDLPESLKLGIAELGFTRCTPIQAQTLPVALAGHDVAGQAQTGTGKTAAFLIALINRLLRDPGAPTRPVNAPRAIVIAPTRELAVQIHADALGLVKHTGLKLALIFGGVDYDKQRRELTDGVDVVIGTPGRIIDYFKQHVFDLRHIQVAVLDEADRMFDLGFIKDIRFLLRRLPHPEARLNMLFSATLSQRVLELAYEHMNDPELIRIEPDKMTADRVRQLVYLPSSEEKIPLLIGLLRRIDARRTMVFVNTKRVAEVLERTLIANGFSAQALSGDVPQKKRLKMMKDFHNGDVAVLIATDVASRGLHIADVSHVFNYDLPQDAEDYVHRIGRTARAGAEGDAISFACDEYAISLPDIEKYIGHQVPRGSIDPADMAEVIPPPPAQWRERAPVFGKGGRGGRPSGGRPGGRPGGGGGGRHGGRPRSGSGGGQGHSRPRPSQEPRAEGAGHPQAASSGPAHGDAPAGGLAGAGPADGSTPSSRRRRRRRGRGGGGNPSGGNSGNPAGGGPDGAPTGSSGSPPAS